jgi:hypothetical protein
VTKPPGTAKVHLGTGELPREVVLQLGEFRHHFLLGRDCRLCDPERAEHVPDRFTQARQRFRWPSMAIHQIRCSTGTTTGTSSGACARERGTR